jgi:hypothetical protein
MERASFPRRGAFPSLEGTKERVGLFYGDFEPVAHDLGCSHACKIPCLADSSLAARANLLAERAKGFFRESFNEECRMGLLWSTDWSPSLPDPDDEREGCHSPFVCRLESRLTLRCKVYDVKSVSSQCSSWCHKPSTRSWLLRKTS